MSDQVLRSLPAVTPVPGDFVVPNAAEWALRVVTATYDGSGAAGAYLPAVQIISPGGVVVATYADRNVSVAAGQNAEVTFGPFLTTQPTSGGGSGLQNDTSPQTGGWFIDTLNGPGGGPNGWGVEIDETAGNGIVLNGVPVGEGDINEASNGAHRFIKGAGIEDTLTGNQHYQLRVNYGGTKAYEVLANFGTTKMGWYGVAPVAQQATPVTLADVIALLQAYGLSA